MLANEAAILQKRVETESESELAFLYMSVTSKQTTNGRLQILVENHTNR
jgi:hypothetical protein